jgi:hypothetical protein
VECGNSTADLFGSTDSGGSRTIVPMGTHISSSDSPETKVAPKVTKITIIPNNNKPLFCILVSPKYIFFSDRDLNPD